MASRSGKCWLLAIGLAFTSLGVQVACGPQDEVKEPTNEVSGKELPLDNTSGNDAGSNDVGSSDAKAEVATEQPTDAGLQDDVQPMDVGDINDAGSDDAGSVDEPPVPLPKQPSAACTASGASVAERSQTQRLMVLSLRDDILKIARVNDKGQRRSFNERNAEMQKKLTDGSLRAGNGDLVIPFSVALAGNDTRLSRVTENHVIEHIRVQMVGQKLGDGDAVIAVAQEGTGQLRLNCQVKDSPLQKLSGTMKLMMPGAFPSDLTGYTSDALKGRPVAADKWSLVLPKDAKNDDIDLSGLGDILVFVTYTDVSQEKKDTKKYISDDSGRTEQVLTLSLRDDILAIPAKDADGKEISVLERIKMMRVRIAELQATNKTPFGTSFPFSLALQKKINVTGSAPVIKSIEASLQGASVGDLHSFVYLVQEGSSEIKGADGKVQTDTLPRQMVVLQPILNKAAHPFASKSGNTQLSGRPLHSTPWQLIFDHTLEPANRDILVDELADITITIRYTSK